MTDATHLNVLFVCSKNQWRSPTGEKVFSSMESVSTRSAGTARSARRQISLGDIRWADLIFVMEDKHASRIKADFRQNVAHTPIHVLDIPDEYHFMDGELVELLKTSVTPLIEAELGR